MSASLTWTPPPNNGGVLPDELKYILGRKLCDTDGTIGYPTDVDKDIIPFLEGLSAAKIKGADELISLIKKYGYVTLTWVH